MTGADASKAAVPKPDRRQPFRRAAARLAAIVLAAGIARAAEAAPGSPAAPPGPACPAVRAPLDLSIGGTPVASLAVGGQRGQFLIDTGASFSAVDAKAYRLPVGSEVDLDTGLCSPARSVFRVEDMGSYQAPAGGQSGRIGTDILGRLSVSIAAYGPSPTMTVRAAPFAPAAAAADGFVEIDRPATWVAGRRSAELPDIPVVGLAIGPVTVPAQLDTGFDDVQDAGIVQGNAALLTALQAQGVAMRPAPSASTLGCAGLRTYPRWRIETAGLAVVATDGTRAAAYPPPLVEIKDDVACGGIAAFAEPFAQIGASWLGRWRQTILDGPGGAVWMLRPYESGAR